MMSTKILIYQCDCFNSSRAYRALHSFPTRRSSDLQPRHPGRSAADVEHRERRLLGKIVAQMRPGAGGEEDGVPDRKSTRLNSSHANISYAVFCLKKKKKNNTKHK